MRKADFLGWIRILVDRDKPVSGQPEVYLDTESPPYDGESEFVDPPGSVGAIFLDGDRFFFCGDNSWIDVEDCVLK